MTRFIMDWGNFANGACHGWTMIWNHADRATLGVCLLVCKEMVKYKCCWQLAICWIIKLAFVSWLIHGNAPYAKWFWTSGAWSALLEWLAHGVYASHVPVVSFTVSAIIISFQISVWFLLITFKLFLDFVFTLANICLLAIFEVENMFSVFWEFYL